MLIYPVCFQPVMKQGCQSRMGFVETVIPVCGGSYTGGIGRFRILCDRKGDICHGNPCFAVLFRCERILNGNIADTNIFNTGLGNRNGEAFIAKIDLWFISVDQMGKLFLIGGNEG